MAGGYTEVFNRTARALLELKAQRITKEMVLGEMIATFLEGGWSDAAESLADFRHDEVIAGLFREHGVTAACLAINPHGQVRRCQRTLLHGGDHVDDTDDSWVNENDPRLYPSQVQVILGRERDKYDREGDPRYGVVDDMVALFRTRKAR